MKKYPTSNARQHGFTLVEVALVVVMIGLLTSVLLPDARGPVARADAVRISIDARSLRHASAEFLTDYGRIPASSEWGAPSPDLSEASTDFFGHKDVEYQLWSDVSTGRVELRARYAETSPAGMALQRLRRSGSQEGSVSWTPTQTVFRLLVDVPGGSSDSDDEGSDASDDDAGTDDDPGSDDTAEECESPGNSQGKGKGKGQGQGQGQGNGVCG